MGQSFWLGGHLPPLPPCSSALGYVLSKRLALCLEIKNFDPEKKKKKNFDPGRQKNLKKFRHFLRQLL